MIYETSINDYENVKPLGKGAYAEVVLVKSKLTGHQSALKIIDKKFFKKQQKQHHIYIEREVLTILRHPGIVKLFNAFEDEDKSYFSLELLDDGNLRDYLNKTSLSHQQIQFYAAELLLILEYVHQNGLVHRDVKPENILLTKDKHFKLADFATAFVYDPEKILAAPKLMALKEKPNRPRGLSFEEVMEKPFFKYCREASFVGTSEFVSPELVNFNLSGPQADLWALGCLLYQLYTNQTPFQTENEYLLFSKISNAEWKRSSQIHEDALALIEILLSKNPEDRFNGEHIFGGKIDYKALKGHKFFKGINFQDMWAQDVPKNQQLNFSFRRRQSRFVTTLVESIPEVQQPRRSSQSKNQHDQQIMKGIVDKEHGVMFFQQFTPRCMSLVIQNNQPYLIYINPQLNNKKTTILLNQCVCCKMLGTDKFIICDAKKKKYVFREKEHTAQEWVTQINRLINS